MRFFLLSIDKVQKDFSLETLKCLIEDSLSKLGFNLLKALPFVRNHIKESYKSFARSKYFVFTKNFLFVFFLCAIPILGVFIKDYVSDQVSIANAYVSIDKSLNMYAAEHKRLFHQLREKSLTEKLYNDPNKMGHTLAELVLLESHLARSSLKTLKGVRWITTDLKAIGPYGTVQNFNPNNMIAFLRFLEQEPNQVQMTLVDNQIYLGMGITEENEFKGYLLMPTSFEGIKNGINTVKALTAQLDLNIDFPPVAMSLDKFVLNSPSYLQIEKKFDWFTYFARNFVVYVLFLLFSMVLLGLKKKKEEKKDNELSKLRKELHSLRESLLSQQKTANLILSRLHDGIESIFEISELFLETQTQASPNVFTEQERTNFVKKIHVTSQSLADPILIKRSDSEIDIFDIINQCLNFYAYKIEQESIQIKQDYTLNQARFTSDKESFLQLMLNLFHQALERTPEKGNICVKMRGAKGIKDCKHILTLEDSGYSFSLEELSNFKQYDGTLLESYFDLEWEEVLQLAQSLNIKIAFDNLSPIGNRITLQIFQHKASEKKPSHDDNIIRLFPAS